MSDEPASAVPARLVPPPSDLTAPFWDATRGRELLVQWCIRCQRPLFYPRAVCPSCLGDQLEWRPSTGSGTVYAVTVEHRPQYPGMQDRAPYAVALVDLDDGIRMMTNVVGCEPDDVAPGMAVQVTWEALPDGRNLPLFEPADA